MGSDVAALVHLALESTSWVRELWRCGSLGTLVSGNWRRASEGGLLARHGLAAMVVERQGATVGSWPGNGWRRTQR
jgi:hypothetical protein